MIHTFALNAGFIGTIPVIPPGATLREGSLVHPDARGKCPGEYYGGGWDGTAAWPEFIMSRELAERFDKLGANVGLKMGVVYVSLDVDILDPVLADQIWHVVAKMFPNAPVRTGQYPKRLWLFRLTEGEVIQKRQWGIHKGDTRYTIDVLGLSKKNRPSQAVIFGQHPSGSTYTWDRNFRHDDIPLITADQMEQLVQAVLALGDLNGYARAKGSSEGKGDGVASELGVLPSDYALLGPVMAEMQNPDLVWDDWVRVGIALKAAGGESAWPLFDNWSSQSPKYDADYTKSMWDGFSPDGDVGFGTLVYEARQYAGGGHLSPALETRIREAASAKGRVAGMPDASTVALPAGALPVTDAEMPLPVRDLGDYVRDANERLMPVMQNVMLWLHHSPIWSGVFAYDAFTNTPMITRPMPGSKPSDFGRSMRDMDYVHVRGQVQQNLFPRIGKQDVIDAVDMVCWENTFEPVQEYLRSLPPSKGGLLDNWMFMFMGVERGDPAKDHYVSQVGRKWLISAVARAMRPGCQVDSALILEGNQGVGKSSALRVLASDQWFGDQLPDFHHKDAKEYLQGKWIVEMAELTSLRRSEVEDMRSFLTSREDRFRPSYGRMEVSRPRRCVFAGSTNRDEYLVDPKGERRIWPVHVGTIDLKGLAAARDGLWREALDAFNAGERWSLDRGISDYATSQQKERVETDPWTDDLETILRGRDQICMNELCLILNVPFDKRDGRLHRRLATCLRTLGFERQGLISHGTFMGRARWVRQV
jgi:hypothetical protein